MFMSIGMLFTFILGTLLHFVYGWSNSCVWVAFFAPINESLFEHMKLLLTPYLLWALVEYAYYGQYMHAFIPGKVIGLYIGFTLMVGLHLFYTKMSIHPVLWADIAIFAFVIFAAFVTAEFVMTLTFFDSENLEIFFDGVLVLTVVLFAMFTVYAPHCWLFQEHL